MNLQSYIKQIPCHIKLINLKQTSPIQLREGEVSVIIKLWENCLLVKQDRCQASLVK